MPVHDWTKVDAGVFHDFHTAWLVEIRNALNGGLLPESYYALAEQAAGLIGPDVLTLERRVPGKTAPGGNGDLTKTAVAVPPKVRHVFRGERRHYHKKQRRIAIRHRSNDRLVAIVEIVSAANKASRATLTTFVEKAASILLSNINLLVIDLYPPTRRDPHGIHVAIWRALRGDRMEHESDKPLTLASYEVNDEIIAYVEPVAVGDRLKDMPLFLDNDRYIDVPLEATYRAAFRGVPRHLQQILMQRRA
jgi:hypothetical protein